MKPSGKERNIAHSSQRRVSSRSSSASHEPTQARKSMTIPQPTMTRNARKGMTTGGQSVRGILSRPTSPAVKLSESMRLPKGAGRVTAKRLRRLATSGQASSTSPAGFSSCHRASMAAIFAGWWCTTYSPFKWPNTSCAGTMIAAIPNPMRSIVRASVRSLCCRVYHAPVAATQNAVVT